jgi:hypothetical protein
MEIFSDHLVVGDQSFSLRQPIDRGEVLRLGLLAPAGAVVRFGPSEQAGTNLLEQDVEGLDWPMQAFPSTIILTNEGERPVWLQGWLEIVKAGQDTQRQRAELEMFERHREEVIPASGFFEINGWYKLEDEKRRWTRETAFARFRNPHKPVSVEIAGVIHGLAGGISPANVSIRLNGHILGEVNAPGAFRQSYFLSDEILGASAWGDLEITTSRTFNPKQLGLSDDDRDLGVQVTGLELHNFELGSDGLIDIGTDGAKKYLGPGWSRDEQAEGFTFAWADAPESRLWVSLPQPAALELDMRVSALRYPSAPAQEVRVYVNDRHLENLVLNDDQWQAFSLNLPASLLSPGLNTFRFVYSYAVSPANVLPNNRDPRTLAVAFDFIRLRPQ